MAARRSKSRRAHPSPRRGVRAARPLIFDERPGDVREARAGRWYARKWHRVLDWVSDSLLLAGYDSVGSARVRTGTYYRNMKHPERVEQHAVARVHDLTDDEEAYEKGLGLELLSSFPEGPGREAGGIRRVVITALTWVPDYEAGLGYDPAWITLGHGMTARTAAAAAARFVRDYTRALDARLVSRELVFTALEIKFWTARAGAEYV
jgi:hypothetical protein